MRTRPPARTVRQPQAATRSPRVLALLAALALGGCTSAQDLLNPTAIAPSTSGPTPAVDLATAGTGSVSAAPLPQAVAQRIRLRFDPIVGATVDAATPLTERLSTQARARGIQIAGSADPTATHVLKGYFSTLSEGGETTVIYVWDVYDPAGNRLHRINGQQKASRGEGWSAVTPAAMQAIADTTIVQLSGWLAAAS